MVGLVLASTPVPRVTFPSSHYSTAISLYAASKLIGYFLEAQDALGCISHVFSHLSGYKLVMPFEKTFQTTLSHYDLH